MTMLLHKSDKKYQTMIEICIMSGLEINISLSQKNLIHNSNTRWGGGVVVLDWSNIDGQT